MFYFNYIDYYIDLFCNSILYYIKFLVILLLESKD